MAYTRIGGSGLNYTNPPLNVSLAAAEVYLIPAGTYAVATGAKSFVQFFDSIQLTWRNFIGNSSFATILSDGFNWRIANTSGSPVSTTITAAGSGYTAVPTVAASAGGSTYTPIVGGAINSSVTITAGGTGYLYPPILVVAQPPSPGIQATAICTISAGVVNAVTVGNAGAGYLVAPAITIVNDPRDTAGAGAVLTTALTGSGTLTGLTIANFGTSTSGTVTLTISGNATATTPAVVAAATDTSVLQNV